MDNSNRPLQTTPAPDPKPSKATDASLVWAALIFVVAAVAAAAWLAMRNSSPAPPPAAEASADAPPAKTTRADKVAPKRTAAARREIGGTGANHSTVIRTSPSEKAADSPLPSETSAPIVTAADTSASPAQPVADPGQPVLVVAPPVDDFIYSNDGSGVIAPRLVSRGFPQSPPVSGVDTRTSALELIVSKSGTVERARISPPSRNWQDAMLLSRAKSFQFVPAQRDGYPVRYRLVMRVETTP